MPHGSAIPSISELIALLQRTSSPTLLVEGPGDAEVYRRLEEASRLRAGTVMPCGSKGRVLALFERRNEFPSGKTAFLVDADTWLFDGRPDEYSEVIVTSGYSIENDILDFDLIERLMESAERDQFRVLIDELARWFAFEMGECRAGRETKFGIGLSELIPVGETSLCDRWCEVRGFSEPPADLHHAISTNPRAMIRGHQLMQAATRLLSAAGRQSKYSKANLLELSLANGTNPSLEVLRSAIRDRLA